MSEKYLGQLDTLSNLFEKVTNDAAATLLELAISRRQLADAIGRAEKAERIAKELGVSEQRFRIAVENFLAWFGSRAEWERENRNAKPVTRQDVIAMRDALRASDYVAEDARAKMEELND